MTDGASQGEYGSPQPGCGPVYPVVPDDLQPLRVMKIGTHPRNRLAASAAGGAAAISAMTFLFMSLQRGAAQRGDPYSLWNTLYHFIEMITAHGRFGVHMDVRIIAPQPKKHKAFFHKFSSFSSKKRPRQQKTPQGGEIPRPAVFYMAPPARF